MLRYQPLLLCLTYIIALTTTSACGRTSQALSSSAPASPSIGATTTLTEEPITGGKPPDLTETALAPTLVIETPAPTPTPFSPPIPSLPLDQALREFPRDSLLYLADHSFLMLAESTATHQLWLTGAPCLTSSAPSPWGTWSADGQFLMVTCSTEPDNGRGYTIKQARLFDMRSGAVRPIVSGAEVAVAWSPVGSRLLMNVQGAMLEGVANAERQDVATLLIDAEAGTVTQLPITAAWASSGYYSLSSLAAGPMLPLAVPRGEPQAAVAWSPDGSRVALVRAESEGGGLYVLNADSSNPQRIAAIEATPAYVGVKDLVGWSADGRWLEIVRLARTRGPQTNPDPQRIWVSPDTGEIRTDKPSPIQFGWWSPDGQWYLSYASETSRNLALFRADGTQIREVAAEWNGGATAPLWAPDSTRFIINKTTTQAISIVVDDLAGHEQPIRTTALDVNGIPVDGMSLVDLKASVDREYLALGLCPLSSAESAAPDPDTPGCQIRIITLAGEERAVIPAGSSTLQVLGWRP